MSFFYFYFYIIILLLLLYVNNTKFTFSSFFIQIIKCIHLACMCVLRESNPWSMTWATMIVVVVYGF